jgi:hypothetical protein
MSDVQSQLFYLLVAKSRHREPSGRPLVVIVIVIMIVIILRPWR